MRKLLGGTALAVGTGILALWGANDHARKIENTISQEAASAVAFAKHDVSVDVMGRDIVVSGQADTPDERQALIAALSMVQGQRVVRDNLTLLPISAPFVFSGEKTPDVQSFAGSVPTEAVRARLAPVIGKDAAQLSLAAGAPETGWAEAVELAASALSLTKEGRFSLSDQSLGFDGLVASPVEEAELLDVLGTLPDGYTLSVTLDVEDDGAPFLLLADLAQGRLLSVSGKLPAEAGPDLLDAAQAQIIDQSVQIARISGPEGWLDTAVTGLSALGALVDGQVRVSETQLSLTGRAMRDGRNQALAILESLPADVALSTDIILFDDGQPLSLRMRKLADGGAETSGKLPFGTTPTRLGVAELGTATIAEIDAVDPEFLDLAARGANALEMLLSGVLEVVDGTPARVSLQGTVLTPEDRAAVIQALGADAGVEITALDDGTPAKFSVGFDVAQGGQVEGKLPEGLTAAQISDLLGLDPLRGAPIQGRIGTADPAKAVFSALGAWLPELDRIQVEDDGAGKLTVTALSAPGVDLDLLAAGLAAQLGEGVALTIEPADTLPAFGAERVNLLTGRSERFAGAAWLPVVDFDATLDRCSDESFAVLERARINFVTGSATLDAKSVRAVNALAAVLQHCVSNDDRLRVEVGGHTDAQGDDASNLDLSFARAQAVAQALVARGVHQDSLVATGFGETQPIADNETEDGRAKNRRTSFEWSVDQE